MSSPTTAVTEPFIVTIEEISRADGPNDPAATLRTIVDRQAARMAFQPLVDLDSGAVFGYEALVRGAHGQADVQPDLLFEEARRADVVDEFDWIAVPPRSMRSFAASLIANSCCSSTSSRNRCHSRVPRHFNNGGTKEYAR